MLAAVLLQLAGELLPTISNQCTLSEFFLKVPVDADKSLWLPPFSSSSEAGNGNLSTTASRLRLPQYAQCEMYKDPTNHSLGTQACVDGYEFHMDGNEWNVISEVKIACFKSHILGVKSW
jgi:hypothetical protein